MWVNVQHCPVHTLIRVAWTVESFPTRRIFTEGVFHSLLFLLVLMGRGAREEKWKMKRQLTWEILKLHAGNREEIKAITTTTKIVSFRVWWIAACESDWIYLEDQISSWCMDFQSWLELLQLTPFVNMAHCVWKIGNAQHRSNCPGNFLIVSKAG